MILPTLAATAAHAEIWVAPRRPGQSVFRNTKQDWQTTDLLVDDVLNETEAGGIRLFWYTAEAPTAERARAQLERAYRELAAHLGIPHFGRAPALGPHPGFVDALADLVQRATADLQRHHCVRCLLPKPASHRAQQTCPNCRFTFPPFLRSHRTAP